MVVFSDAVFALVTLLVVLPAARILLARRHRRTA
jgi:hypothetical protein